MNEQFIKWYPFKNISDKYYIDAIIDNFEGLSILVVDKSTNSNVRLIWECGVETYKCTDETARSILWSDKQLTKWTFFEVLNSGYINWLVQQSCGIYKYDELKHYFIAAANCTLDIICTYEPIFLVD